LPNAKPIDNNHKERHGDVKKNCAKNPDFSRFLRMWCSKAVLGGFGEASTGNPRSSPRPYTGPALFLSTRKRTAPVPAGSSAMAHCGVKLQRRTPALVSASPHLPSGRRRLVQKYQSDAAPATATAVFCSPEAEHPACAVPVRCSQSPHPVRPPEPAPQPGPRSNRLTACEAASFAAISKASSGRFGHHYHEAVQALLQARGVGRIERPVGIDPAAPAPARLRAAHHL